MPPLPIIPVVGEAIAASWGNATRDFLAETDVYKATVIGQTPYVSDVGVISMLPLGAALQVERMNAGLTAPEFWTIPSDPAAGTPGLRSLGTSSAVAAVGSHSHGAYQSVSHDDLHYAIFYPTKLWSTGGVTQITTHSAHAANEAFTVGPGAAMPSGGGVNISAGMNLFKGGTQYTNPDYVFEHAFTGKVERFSAHEGAEGYPGLLPLPEVEAYAREHFQLPQVGRGNVTTDPCGVHAYRRMDVLLEAIEELYLHLFGLDHQLRRLEGAA